MCFGSALLSILPWEEFIDPVDLVVGDATENIGQPSLGIDGVEFSRLNQSVGNTGGDA